MEIALEKNDSVLITERLEKQPLAVYLSNLAGSILGVLGAVGFILNVYEQSYENYIKNRKIVRSLKQLTRNRIEITEKNFTAFSIKENQETRSVKNIDSLEYFNITMNNQLVDSQDINTARDSNRTQLRI